jgi:cytochrome c-type biogenesis protein
MGITFGAAWTPCVGPLLGAALVTAAHSSTKTQGIALLVAYAMGVGVPFVAASLALDSAPTLTTRLRSLGRALYYVAGVTLIVLGVLLVTGRYNSLTSLLARFTAT